ncbi:hypothetical protein INT46_001590 [Mucor plumbeus]|uniref:Uncharacterized protein n=1 Tax=Mucor plumbeus TaxID=97098 RepID=A0A8H7RLM7_9FUNG|nr:hypothetical protein INT46_001590 [Mucor plumbeus]
MFSVPLNCPATCELCGQWMPGHSSSCPRSGVHPSQWSMNNVDPMNLQEYNDNFKESTTFSINWPYVNNTPEAEQEE